MSFGLTVPAGPVADLATAIDTAAESYANALAANDSQPSDETLELIALGRKHALAIAKELPGDVKLVTVTISGHANPDHKPVKGWANDSVIVGVYSADPVPTA